MRKKDYDEKNFGGETGIRTLGRLPFNGFQDRRIRPLCHLSDRREYYRNVKKFANTFLISLQIKSL